MRQAEGFYVICGRNALSTQMLEVSLLGVGTVLRLERDAWSMVKLLRQATNVHTHLLPPPYLRKKHPTPAW